MSSSFRLVYWIGLDLFGPSSQSSKHLCIFGLYVSVFWKLYLLHFTLVLAWWDWPFTWWTDQLLSFSAWHCWLGHWPVKIVPDMTYNVFSGTLNPTLLLLNFYQIPSSILSLTCLKPNGFTSQSIHLFTEIYHPSLAHNHFISYPEL